MRLCGAEVVGRRGEKRLDQCRIPQESDFGADEPRYQPGWRHPDYVPITVEQVVEQGVTATWHCPYQPQQLRESRSIRHGIARRVLGVYHAWPPRARQGRISSAEHSTDTTEGPSGSSVAFMAVASAPTSVTSTKRSSLMASATWPPARLRTVIADASVLG